jgi:DUF438 domain-containing protein
VGELTAEQVTAMCDLHVQIFKESLDVQDKPESKPGHPVHTYELENKNTRSIIEKLRKAPNFDLIEDLKKINIHYTRLENQLFPLLEKAGITGPSTVMWAKHDEIRQMFKEVTESNLIELLTAVDDMIYKDDMISFKVFFQMTCDSMICFHFE